MNSIIPEYEIKELPSRFIPYPEGIKIYAKPHNFGSSLNIELVGKNNISTMSETLEGVRVEGMAKNLLTPQDILFLGIYRNLLSSKHDKIDLRSYCPNCLNENHHVRTLKELKFRTIEDFDKSVYPVEVDFDDYTMWFEFLTFKDFDFCLKKYRGHKLTQLALQVKKVIIKESGETLEKPEYRFRADRESSTKLIEDYITRVKDMLYTLVDEDKDALEEVISLLEDYGLKPIDVECQDERCKKTYPINLDSEGVLVMPFRESEKSPRDRIKLRKDNVDKSDNFEADESERSGDVTRADNEEQSKRELKAVAATSSVKNKKKPLNQIQYFDKENRKPN